MAWARFPRRQALRRIGRWPGRLLLLALVPLAFLSCTKRSPMIIETVIVGPLGVNCLILGCPETKQAVVIDPGAEPAKVLAAVRRLGLTVVQVLNTHGHFDHVGGNRGVVEATGAPLLIHTADVAYLSRAAEVAALYGAAAENSPQPAQALADGMTVRFGTRELQVLHTPGHTPGGCCFFLPAEKLLISGDTLFADSVGRTDLPGGSTPTLLASIREKLLPLPDDTRVIPGHGPDTTIGHERKYNPYLR